MNTTKKHMCMYRFIQNHCHASERLTYRRFVTCQFSVNVLPSRQCLCELEISDDCFQWDTSHICLWHTSWQAPLGPEASLQRFMHLSEPGLRVQADLYKLILLLIETSGQGDALRCFTAYLSQSTHSDTSLALVRWREYVRYTCNHTLTEFVLENG